jgi:hypothetical protein
VGPENQQVCVNQLAGASRKTVLNILSTLSSMLATAKNWGYSSGEIALRKLVLPERNVHVPAHFTRFQVASIFSLANEPWRTFFVVLTLTGLRAGEALGLQRLISTFITSAFTSFGLRGTEKFNPQRARRVQRR